MKKMMFIIILLNIGNAYSQSTLFHFDDTITTLIKNTNQSPAHWYLEIYSDCLVDTTLRWKATFVDIPAQWNVNFDDGSTFHSTVNDGDSADFLLQSGLAFPEKLIIGAAFNYYPGVGSILFDIYDPFNPNEFVTIEYHYIVGQSSLEDLTNERPYSLHENVLNLKDEMVGSEVSIMSLDGRRAFHAQSISEGINLNYLDRGYYFIHIVNEKSQYLTKEYFSN